MNNQVLLWIWVHILFYCFLPQAPPLRYKTNYSLEEWVTTWVGWEVDWSLPLRILALHLLPTSENHCSGRKSMEFLHTPVCLVQPYRCPTLYITNSAGTSWESKPELFKILSLFMCIYPWHLSISSVEFLPPNTYLAVLYFKFWVHSSRDLDPALSSLF